MTKNLTYDLLLDEQFNIPVILDFTVFTNNEVVKNNAFTEEAFIKELERHGFNHVIDEGTAKKYIVAKNKKYWFISDKDQDTYKDYIYCGENYIKFIDLSLYTDEPVDKQYYKVTNIDNILEDEDFFLPNTWVNKYFYWLNSQQKCLPTESGHYNKDFEKLNINELTKWLDALFDHFICEHSV